ncbi:MAG TPA: thiolase family protein [Anaerolineae bacterium]
MKEVVIVNPIRTAIGSFGGALRTVPAYDLAKTVIECVIQGTGIDPGQLDEVIFGNIGQPSEAANISRVSALYAGIPQSVPAYTVQRNCASGMQAITSAYQAIQAGDGEIILVGGTENMSQIPYVIKGARWGLRLRHSELTDALWEGLTDPTCNLIMGGTAENIAERYGISREEQDKYAVLSHKKAFAATRMGKFKDEIVPVEVIKKAAGQEVAREAITQDEGINPALTVQKAALYPTVFKKGGTVTPANACGMNDGAAAMLVMTREKADKLGLAPMARIIGYGYTGVDPAYMGIGPASALPKALGRAGIKYDQLDNVEINEAFAAQVLGVAKIMQEEGHGWDPDKTNPNGGAIALGHPVGCSGARIVVTLLHELKRKNGRYGAATLCVGGGQGGALVVERI